MPDNPVGDAGAAASPPAGKTGDDLVRHLNLCDDDDDDISMGISGALRRAFPAPGVISPSSKVADEGRGGGTPTSVGGEECEEGEEGEEKGTVKNETDAAVGDAGEDAGKDVGGLIAVLQASLTLELDFALVSEPEGRRCFEEGFKSDLGRSLGVPSSLIVVDSLEAGSVIVQFSVLAAASCKEGGAANTDVLGSWADGTAIPQFTALEGALDMAVSVKEGSMSMSFHAQGAGEGVNEPLSSPKPVYNGAVDIDCDSEVSMIASPLLAKKAEMPGEAALVPGEATVVTGVTGSILPPAATAKAQRVSLSSNHQQPLQQQHQQEEGPLHTDSPWTQYMEARRRVVIIQGWWRSKGGAQDDTCGGGRKEVTKLNFDDEDKNERGENGGDEDGEGAIMMSHPPSCQVAELETDLDIFDIITDEEEEGTNMVSHSSKVGELEFDLDGELNDYNDDQSSSAIGASSVGGSDEETSLHGNPARGRGEERDEDEHARASVSDYSDQGDDDDGDNNDDDGRSGDGDDACDDGDSANLSDAYRYIAAITKASHENIAILMQERGVDMEASTVGTEWNLLHMAASTGNSTLANVLVRSEGTAGRLLNARNALGETPLFVAVAYERIGVALLLLESGADVDATDAHGRTPLFKAATQGCNTALVALLGRGARVDQCDETGRSPLLMAVGNGEMVTVRLLLEFDHAVDLEAEGGWTALHFAAQRGHAGIAAVLLGRGADPLSITERGWSALHIAAATGFIEVASLLVQQGVGVNLDTPDGTTPLFVAAENGRAAVAEALLGEGADVNFAKADGETPLFVAAQEGYAEVMAQLLRGGADVYRSTADGMSPLHASARQGHVAACRLLLAHESNVDKTNAAGETPLFLAAQAGTCRRYEQRMVCCSVLDSFVSVVCVGMFIFTCI